MKNTDTENQRLLTEKQTAKFLSISRSTLRQQRHTGPIGGEGRIPFIPFIKIGRNVRYDRADLEKWIKDNRINVEHTLKD